MTKDELRTELAKIIEPDWFGNESGTQHVLNNYHDQHVHYQERAWAKADAILELLSKQCP